MADECQDPIPSPSMGVNNDESIEILEAEHRPARDIELVDLISQPDSDVQIIDNMEASHEAPQIANVVGNCSSRVPELVSVPSSDTDKDDPDIDQSQGSARNSNTLTPTSQQNDLNRDDLRNSRTDSDSGTQNDSIQGDGRSSGSQIDASQGDGRSSGSQIDTSQGDGRSSGSQIDASQGDGRSSGSQIDASQGDGRSSGSPKDLSQNGASSVETVSSYLGPLSRLPPSVEFERSSSAIPPSLEIESHDKERSSSTLPPSSDSVSGSGTQPCSSDMYNATTVGDSSAESQSQQKKSSRSNARDHRHSTSRRSSHSRRSRRSSSRSRRPSSRDYRHRSSHSRRSDRDHRRDSDGRRGSTGRRESNGRSHSSRNSHFVNVRTQTEPEKEPKKARIPWYNHERLSTYKYKKYFRIETDPNGSADICHLYWDEIRDLPEDLRTKICLEFVKLSYSEDANELAYHVIGIVHGAGEELPDLLDYMADHYGSLNVKTGSLTGRGTESLTMSDYRNEVYKKYSHGTFRYPPLQEMSICGVQREEAGAFFPDFVQRLENNPCMKPVMPWGSHSIVHTNNPRESNDGPIFWVRPGEQTLPSNESSRPKGRIAKGVSRLSESRGALFEDRTKPHADQIGIDGDNVTTAATAAVGVLKAVVCGKKGESMRATKDVIAFDAKDYYLLCDDLALDLYEPPLKQCVIWLDTGKLNLLRRRGYRYAHVQLDGNDVYYLPRKIIHQFQTISAVASVAWHIRWKDYFKINGAPNIHTATGLNKGAVYHEKKDIPQYVPPTPDVDQSDDEEKIPSPTKRADKTLKGTPRSKKEGSSKKDAGPILGTVKVKKFEIDNNESCIGDKPSTSASSNGISEATDDCQKAGCSYSGGQGSEIMDQSTENEQHQPLCLVKEKAAERHSERKASPTFSSPDKNQKSDTRKRNSVLDPSPLKPEKPLRENILAKKRKKVTPEDTPTKSFDVLGDIMEAMDRSKEL